MTQGRNAAFSSCVQLRQLVHMAASSDLQLQALQLQIRNLQQKLDWKQLKINQRDKHIRDLRDTTPALAADLERLERSICRLSLQMEHMQDAARHQEPGVVVSHLCDAGEDRLLGAHDLRPPAQREQDRGHHSTGQAAGRALHRHARGRPRVPAGLAVVGGAAAPPAAPAHSAPPPWAEQEEEEEEGEDREEGAGEEGADEAAHRKKAKVKVERRKEQRHAAAAAAGREPGRRGNPNWSKSDARPARATAGGRVLLLLGG